VGGWEGVGGMGEGGGGWGGRSEWGGSAGLVRRYGSGHGDPTLFPLVTGGEAEGDREGLCPEDSQQVGDAQETSGQPGIARAHNNRQHLLLECFGWY